MLFLSLALVVILPLSAGAGIVEAQDSDPNAIDELHLTGIVPLDELVAQHDVAIHYQSATLSPDGTRLAWSPGDGICVLTLADGDMRCYADAEQPVQVGSALYWSPDSQMIAFHEDALRMLYDADIWLLDIAGERFLNVTDDDVSGSFMRMDRVPGVDILPTWDPASGDLYFFRYARTLLGDANAIYRVRADDIAADAEPEPVANLTQAFPVPFPVYDIAISTLDGSADIAPDGSAMAFVARPATGQPEQFAIWRLDLASGAVEQIAAQTAIVGEGLPDWYREGTMVETDWIDGLAWLPDSETLIVSSFNAQTFASSLTPVLYMLDATGGEVTALRDLTGVPDVESYLSAPLADGDDPAVWGRQQSSVMLPGGEAVVYTSGIVPGVDAIAFSALPLGAEDEADGVAQPVRLATIPQDEFTLLPVYRTSAGASGGVVRVLSYGYVLIFERGA